MVVRGRFPGGREGVKVDREPFEDPAPVPQMRCNTSVLTNASGVYLSTTNEVLRAARDIA